jgi:hypothetical protein
MTKRFTDWLLAFMLLLPMQGWAEVVDDWGTVATPLTSEASFSFEQYDLTGNFTHEYSFSLEGETGATYEVTFDFDTCKNGCGNPDLSFGIYDANGGLISSSSGTLVLSPGNYVFQVKADGMGSGNTLDYWGSVTFSATAQTSESMVAPVPEPTSIVLTGAGLAIIGWSAHRRRRCRDPQPCGDPPHTLATGVA